MNDEEIMAALAAVMDDVEWTRNGTDPIQFVTKDRRVRLFGEVDASEQPACFQAEWGVLEGQRTGMPYKTELTANWIIFQCVGNDKSMKGAIENNLIVKACRDALAPKPTDPGFFEKRNTLGGLVHHCFIDGRVFKDPGDLDGQGMIVIPIKLLVP